VRYGSVCSGIEAASVAWEPLGWKASFLSEIDKFPRAVLAAHYPEVPLHGDFTTIKAGEYDPIDLLVGGTPCQSFSVAGLRAGLADDRGNLALEYLKLAQRLRPKWLVWENVPGVLSSAGGRDFGSILGGLVELGYGFAYRVLDAQYFGVPQRRRRVFVVGYLGDWRRAAAVLFERYSLQGHSAPRREAGQRAAPTISARTEGGGGLGTDFDLDGGLIANALTASRSSAQCPNEDTTLIASTGDVSHCLNAGGMGRQDFETETLITGALACSGGRAFPGTSAQDAGEGFLLPVAYALQERAGCENLNAGPDGAGYREGAAYTLEARQTPQAVAYNITPSQSNKDYNARASERSQAITGNGNRPSARGGDVIAFDTTQMTSKANRSNPQAGDPSHPLAAGAHAPAIAFNARQDPTHGPVADPLGTKDTGHGFLRGSAVRRLTPRECERLQGFPDDYTLISHRGKPAADGPRYKALGNSMAVPVMAWIGQRIQMVEEQAA
jgi:DNA (cytosine-5)-methyltransferase 1